MTAKLSSYIGEKVYLSVHGRQRPWAIYTANTYTPTHVLCHSRAWLVVRVS